MNEFDKIIEEISDVVSDLKKFKEKNKDTPEEEIDEIEIEDLKRSLERLLKAKEALREKLKFPY